ncbi:MAG: hypothetical protein RLZZ440_542, partial [Planctomycetota bacterium]
GPGNPRDDQPGTHPSATSLGPHATHRPHYGCESAIDRAILALRQALAIITHLKVDPSRPELYTGMLNTGHTYGDHLSEDDRLAVLEFLKCL